MKLIRITYFVLVASIILTIYNIYELDFNNIGKGPFAGLASKYFTFFSDDIYSNRLKKERKKRTELVASL